MRLLLLLVLLSPSAGRAEQAEPTLQALLARAEATFEAGHDERALHMAKMVLALPGADKTQQQQALRLAGRAACKLKQLAEAQRIIDQIMDKTLVRSACLAAGLTLRETAVPTAPRPTAVIIHDKARRLYEGALILVGVGRPLDAVRVLQQAYKLSATPALIFEQARCYAAAGRMQSALSTYRRFVGLHKDPVERLLAAARFSELLAATPAARAAR